MQNIIEENGTSAVKEKAAKRAQEASRCPIDNQNSRRKHRRPQKINSHITHNAKIAAPPQAAIFFSSPTLYMGLKLTQIRSLIFAFDDDKSHGG